MSLFAKLAAVLRSLHWRRGLRAGFAVATAMIVCRMLHHSMGWAALGGFEATLVDNGGPYRSRMNTIGTVLLGGAFCGFIGNIIPHQLLLAALVTALVCFGVTFARVASQPIASTSVIILVIYFAGFGSTDRTLTDAAANIAAYFLGGLWAAAISLFLWPVDPFRPARLEVAACYELLADFTSRLRAVTASQTHHDHDDDHAQAVLFKRQLRARFESARSALNATAARAPVRTVRARNLSVLLETADLLFVAAVRLTELAELMPAAAIPSPVGSIAQQLSGAERAIANGLSTRPADNGASFGPKGSHRLQYVVRPTTRMQENSADMPPSGMLETHLRADLRDALENIEIAFEAVRAVWTGAEIHPQQSPGAIESTQTSATPTSSAWLDAIRQNLTLDSIMMRHALRIAMVGAVDVLLISLFHISHGFWLGMTSIIVLQPYNVGIVRKGVQRVAGTIAGGILAALLAASVHGETGLIVVITISSILTLATYAVDYGWYSFFLTPTFVLLSVSHPRDWRYAGVRIVTTLLGAIVAVVAMRLLWPQSLRVELARLLSRCASACSAYLRAVLLFWGAPPAQRNATERKLLAPARRACGLTSQDAEEALDRILLEPNLPGFATAASPAPHTESALTYTTYIRRFTQCITTLAFVGTPDARTVARINNLIRRLGSVCATLDHDSNCASTPYSREDGAADVDPSLDPASLAEQMLQRMERQAGVLERAATTLAIARPPLQVAEQDLIRSGGIQ